MSVLLEKLIKLVYIIILLSHGINNCNVIYDSQIGYDYNSSCNKCLSSKQLNELLYNLQSSLDFTNLKTIILITTNTNKRQYEQELLKLTDVGNSRLNLDLRILYNCYFKHNEINHIKEINNNDNSYIHIIQKENIQKDEFRILNPLNVFTHLTSVVSFIAENHMFKLEVADQILSAISYEEEDEDKDVEDNNGISFMQTKQIIPYKIIEIRLNKGLRLCYSLSFLIISAIVVFLLVKSTVDWATIAQHQLNRINDLKAREFTNRIADRFNLYERE
jgi:hypothetical protein